jgi:hypothetical protein
MTHGGLSDRGVPGMLRKAEAEVHRLHAVLMMSGRLDRHEVAKVLQTLNAAVAEQDKIDAAQGSAREIAARFGA